MIIPKDLSADCGLRIVEFRLPSQWLLIVGCVLWLCGAMPAHADSPASKNRLGNQLFEQGKFQEAEKVYLDAQGVAPGRPELLYNLGNTLLKQKKYDQALQSLRQAVGKSDKGLQAKGWYNSGDAFFEMGNYKDAAQAFIQALRIDPGDRDAKYNLELALRKLQEQQKQQKGQGKNQHSKDKDKEDSIREQQASDNSPEKQQEQKPKSGKNQQGQNKPEESQATQADRRDGTVSKERALQLLDALRGQELQDQKKLMERQPKRKAAGRDW